MKRCFNEKEVVLLGVTRFVNHSCLANTRFFRGYSCNYLRYRTLRLQVIRTIKQNKEITVNYGDSFFGDFGECKCDVCKQKQLGEPQPHIYLADRQSTELVSESEGISIDIVSENLISSAEKR